MLRATIRGLLARKLRLLLSGTAIILGVAFVTGTFVLTDSLGRVFDRLFTDINAGTAVIVRSTTAFGNGTTDGGDNTREPVPASLLPQILKVDGVREVQGGLFQPATLVVRGKAFKTGGAPIAIVPLDTSSGLTTTLVKRGRAPTGPTEVAIDGNTVKRAKLKIGDTVTVIGVAARTNATLVGVTGLKDADTFAGAALLDFTPARAQQLSGYVGRWEQIAVSAEPGVSENELKQRIAAALPKGTEAITGKQSTDETASQIKDGIKVFSYVLVAFGLISLFVGAFLIFNTFSMLIAQRTRELALMRALGASRRQVTGSVLGEALVVATVSSLAGFGLGIVVALGLRGLLNSIGFGLPAGDTVIAPRTFVFGMIVGIGITLLAALLPARRAGRMPPVQAMRDSGPAEERSLRRRTIVGGVLLLLGVLGLLSGLSQGQVVLVALGAVLTFIGVAVVAPLFARPVVSALGAPLLGLGLPSRLARGNAIRSPRRTATTAAALMIGLALVAMVSVFGQSAKKSLVLVVQRSLGADYILHTEQFLPFSPLVVDELKKSPVFTDVASFPNTQAQVDGKKADIQGVDPSALEKVLKLNALSGSLTSLRDGQLAISEDEAKDRKLSVGSTVKVLWLSRKQATYTVGAVYARNQFAGGWLAPNATFEANVTSKATSVVALRVKEGVPPTESRAELTRITHDYPDLTVQDQADFIQQQASQVNTLLNVVYGMLVLSVLIAGLGIINTLALSVIERTRELGLLRAIGLARGQTSAMILVEGLLVAVFGAVLGIVVGVGFGAALVSALHDQGITEFSVPYVRLGIVLVVGAVVGVIAAVVPAWRAARLNVLQAIATA